MYHTYGLKHMRHLSQWSLVYAMEEAVNLIEELILRGLEDKMSSLKTVSYNKQSV